MTRFDALFQMYIKGAYKVSVFIMQCFGILNFQAHFQSKTVFLSILQLLYGLNRKNGRTPPENLLPFFQYLIHFK